MYRGFEQNKKHSFSSRAFSRKAPVSRKGRALTLSTEIICRSGFFFGFAVTSRVSPIHRIFTQRIYITKSASGCQAFMQDFRNFFEIFSIFCGFSPLCASFLYFLRKFFRFFRFQPPYRARFFRRCVSFFSRTRLIYVRARTRIANYTATRFENAAPISRESSDEKFPQKSVEFYKKICYNTSRKLYREDF